MDTNRLSYKPRVRAPPSAPFPVLCQQDLRRPSHSCAGAVFFEASNEAQHRHQVVVPADALAARTRHPVLAAARSPWCWAFGVLWTLVGLLVLIWLISFKTESAQDVPGFGEK
jgi:hypothetical protein